MIKLTESKIAEIKSKASKPTVYNGKFPLNEISDREFEALCYDIFKERIKFDDKDFFGKFDDIDLMSGIGEKGFDSTLYNKGQINGLVQCKKYKNRITKPQAIDEILKFVLYTLTNPDFDSYKNNFTYFFISSSGFANTAITFLSDFNRNILKENLTEKCHRIASKYESLKKIDLNIPQIESILKTINIKKIIPEDLNHYLNEYTVIAKTYFKIFTATDNTLIENIISNYLDPMLTKLNGQKIKNTKDFSYRFKMYLSQVINRYSSAQTLVFGNQQKKIEDYYYPLTLCCKIDSESPVEFKTSKYIDDFLPKYKKVLICDQGGMGKSTILKWLFRSSIIENKGIPIFIELRTLNKENTIINEITSQLEPIDYELEKSVTRKLIAKGNFIFFLDGYDEISKSNKKEVTRDLSNFISKADNNLFIITSRPENALKSFGNFQEFNINRLKTDEAYELIKKIGNNNPKSVQLVEQLKSDDRKELGEYLESPLLISLLYKKFEHRETIPLQKQEFYWEVYEALFQAHDIIKGDRFEREKETGLSLYEFHKILRGLAYFTAFNNQIEFSHVELERFLEKSNNFFPGVKFDANKFISDLTSNVPIFQKEGLKYKWAHKTLQEYFASEFICRDTKENQISILNHLYTAANPHSYYGILDLCYEIDFKSFRKAILYPKCKEYSKYYNEYIEEFKLHDDFDRIVQIANHQFESKIAFLSGDENSLVELLRKFDSIEKNFENFFNEKIDTMKIQIGYSKILNSNITTVHLNYGFPIKDFLLSKKSTLLNNNHQDNKKIKLTHINYETTIDNLKFHILPKTIQDILEKGASIIKYYSYALSHTPYDIDACNELIKEVEMEDKKEKNVNFFFNN